MKKLTVYAMSTAAALTMVGALPFSSLAAQNTYSMGRANVIVIGGNGSRLGCAELGDMLSGCTGTCFVPGAGGNGRLCFSGNGCEVSFGDGCGNDSGSIIVPEIPDDGGNGSGSTTAPETPDDGGNDSGSTIVTADASISEVVSLVNAERAKAGLAPLTLNSAACKAAETRAREIQTSFSHTRPGGRNFSTALTEAGVSFSASGENIAYGQPSASAVMSDWMSSSGHRANILNTAFTEIGVAHVKNASGTDYWVQLFIR